MGCGASTAQPSAQKIADYAPSKPAADSSYPPADAPLKNGEAEVPAVTPAPVPVEPSAPGAASATSEATADSSGAAVPAPAAIDVPPAAPAEPPPPPYEPPTHEQAAELFEAVEGGDIEALQALLDAGVPAGVVDDDGNTPLHKAAEGEEECAKALIEKLDKSTGVYEAKNADGNTCLMVAIEYEDAGLCKTFIEAGCRVTEEVLAAVKEKDSPEIITAVTGEVVADKVVAKPKEGGERRVSVSCAAGGGNVNEFTSAFQGEQGRRMSVGGAPDDSTKSAADAAALVPEKDDDPLDNPTDHMAAD